MHILISIVMAFLVAWAFRKRGKSDPLGWWRVSACVTVVLVPHVDKLFFLLNPAFAVGYQFTFMWSVLLAPLFAFAVAQGFSYLAGGHHPESKHTTARFFVPVMATWGFNLLLALFSEKGIALFAPLWFGRVSLNVVHSFDVGLLIGLVVFALLAASVKSFRTDIARFTLLLLLVYIGIVGTFKLKADGVGDAYGEAMGVEVEAVYTLPQPLSPFYWHVIVETDAHRLHDTRISLKRDKTKTITPDMNRVQRVKAAYMPVHAAVWRIKERFGLDNPAFVARGWQSHIRQSLGWASRFLVYQKMKTYQGMQCVQLKDLRFESPKFHTKGQTEGYTEAKTKGVYLLCRNKKGADKGAHWQAYQAYGQEAGQAAGQAAGDASFFRLDVIY